jgi:hypothetical protein
VEPQADAVPAPASAIPEVAVATASAAPTTIPPSVLQNGGAQLTVEDLREAAARRFALPDGVQTAADVAAEAENGAAQAPAAQPREPEPPDLLEAAELLRKEVANLQLSLEVDGVATAREQREALLTQLDDYLLPRLRRLDAPLLAVVGGSTGAGKSTLVNSIARREVTRSGVLRPTTRSPVLVHHPYDSGAFLSQRVLPGLARVTSEAPEPAQPIDVDAPRITALRLVPHDGITPGLAIIDAPDIDSVVETNRDLAVQLLASADLWLFVTTSARYGDAVPWEMLKQAVDRGVAVAVVLDRVPPEVMQEVRLDLATRLRDRGLGTAPMFTIPETTLEAGFLPERVVAPLAGWLKRLALDERARDVVVRRTLIGILDSLRERVQMVAAAAHVQDAVAVQLAAAVEAAYDSARVELRRSLADGSVLRGEVPARWQEFVATGDVFRSFEPGPTRLVDRVRALVRPRVAPAQPVLTALADGVEALVQARAREALENLARNLAQNGDAAGAGAALVASRPELGALPADAHERMARTVREWRATLAEQLRELPHEGPAGALGLDGAVAALSMLTLEADTWPAGAGDVEGDSRAETVERQDGAPGVLAEAVLSALYGADAVAPLVADARADLTARLEQLLEAERERVRGVLAALGLRPGRGEALTARALVVEEAR